MSESLWNDPRITAFVLDELPDDERLAFESEIAANPELAGAVEQAQMLTNQLAAHFSSESTPQLDSARRAAILSESTLVANETASGPTSVATSTTGGWFRRHWVSIAVAASLAGVSLSLLVPSVQSSREMAMMTGDQAYPGAAAVQVEQLQSTIELAAPAPESAELELQYQVAPSEPTVVEEFAMDLDAAGAGADVAAEPFAAPQSVPLAKSQEKSAASKESTQRESNRAMMVPTPMSASAPSAAAPLGSPAPVADSFDRALATNAAPDGPVGGMAEMRSMSGSLGGGMGSGIASLPQAPPVEIHSPYGDAIDEGRGPGISGDKFDPIVDNAFKRVNEHPLSTFSADVDTASYSKVRDFLVRANQLPRPDAVRIEELINYFDYNYAAPASDSEHPFAAHAELVACPWNEKHRLARIAIKGKTINEGQRPACNLVFLLDTSGSMDAPNKLPLVQEGMKLLLSQLGENDRVAIVVYAGSAGLVLDSTPASEAVTIRRALTQLSAGGSTNGGAGITLAYQTARDHFIQDGVNRVILCTDGDFNVGATGTDSLVDMVENEAKGGVFLTVLGFGMGNHNDSMLEQISGKGNGNYAFIDTQNEAKKVLVEQTDSTLVTIAKDVKLQVEFNPNRVSAYRLIGYENRILAKEDFNDDKKDAGEIGAGHTVTALYEIVPATVSVDAIGPPVDELRYQKPLVATAVASSDEWLTVKLRYKQPDGDKSTLVDFPVIDSKKSFEEADVDVRFAAAVAGFGMKLRRSEYAGSWTLADVEKVAASAKGDDRFGLRAEFVELVQKAAALGNQER